MPIENHGLTPGASPWMGISTTSQPLTTLNYLSVSVCLTDLVSGAGGKQEGDDFSMSAFSSHAQRRPPLAVRPPRRRLNPCTRIDVRSMADEEHYDLQMSSGARLNQGVLIPANHLIDIRAT